MHVCHVNLARGFRGGERQTELLVQRLNTLGVEQTLVARHGEPLLERLSGEAGLQRVALKRPYWLRHQQLVGDLIHAHENKAAHLAAFHRSRGGPPYLITRRVDNLPGTGGTTRRMYQRADRVVAISSAIAAVLTDYDAALQPQIIPSALGKLPSDAAAVARLKQHWRGKTVIGHIGALDNSQKGQVYLIRAMRLLQPHFPHLHCMLLGDGKDEAWFRQEAEGLDCVEFAGHVPNVGDYLSAFDLFAFPSLHEGLGSSLLDAMDFSLPIVASQVDGIPDLVEDGVNGLLVPAGDAAALAAALGRLIQNHELAGRMGRAGKQASQNYTPEKMAERYLALYQDMLNK